MVTCPSAMSTTLLSLRTHNTVVPCNARSPCALFRLICICLVYSQAGRRTKIRSNSRVRDFVEGEYPVTHGPQRRCNPARIIVDAFAAGARDGIESRTERRSATPAATSSPPPPPPPTPPPPD